MSRGLALVFALSFLTFAGCAETGMVDDASGAIGERNDFKSAKSAGSSSAWSSFLEKYPQSTRRGAAQQEFDDAVWRETMRTDTASAYLSFALTKTSHKMAGESRNRCRAILKDARGLEQDYREYLNSYPDDEDADALRQALKTVRYNLVSRKSDMDASSLFVSQYPGTTEAAKLLPSLQAKAYEDAETAGTRLAYQFFLKRYPSASQAANASAKLAGLPPASVPQGNPGDLKKLLPQLRRVSGGLVSRECRKGLESRLKRGKDLFGADAEVLRTRLKELAGAGDNPPQFCAEQAMAVAPAARQTAANAVRALALLMERRQYLDSVLSGPDKIAASAEQTADQAETTADTSESAELEIEALYGATPADPQHPEDTASKNAHEAVRRAKRAGQLVGGMSKKAEIAEIVASAQRQSDLLIDILASLERPSGDAAEAPAASAEPATQPEKAQFAEPAPAPEPAAPAAEEPAQPAGDLTP